MLNSTIKYRVLGSSGIKIPCLGLGTWAFANDIWWGTQKDGDSADTLRCALELGVNFIDTAPVYGRGHSEKIIGNLLRKGNIRDKVILATKAGLAWQGPKIYHNLKRKRILDELNASLSRLRTDKIDLYQIHWPDPAVPIKESAETMCELYKDERIGAIGVCNYSVKQIKEFMDYSPLHSVQMPYNMFRREIEKDIVPFCIKNNIGIIAYSPLDSGVLTGKFFFGKQIPNDKIRSINPNLRKENFEKNKRIILKLKEIASSYNKSMAQLALNWAIARPGITCAIPGARNIKQIEENAGSAGWHITGKDAKLIESILSS